MSNGVLIMCLYVPYILNEGCGLKDAQGGQNIVKHPQRIQHVEALSDGDFLPYTLSTEGGLGHVHYGPMIEKHL